MKAISVGDWEVRRGGMPLALQQLFEELPDIYLFAKNLEGKFTFANAAFAAKCGLRKTEQVLGLSDFDLFPHHLAEKYVQDDKQVIQTGRPLARVVELVVNADRTVDWHSTTKVPVWGAGRRVIGLAGVTRDFKRTAIGSAPFTAMEKVIDHVMENYAETIEIETLASLVSLSVSQFERKFKAFFGVSPLRYITMLRIQAACQALVGTDLLLSHIAAANGFYDQSHFNRQFRAQMGMSPSAYRKAHAAGRRIPGPLLLKGPGMR